MKIMKLDDLVYPFFLVSIPIVFFFYITKNDLSQTYLNTKCPV